MTVRYLLVFIDPARAPLKEFDSYDEAVDYAVRNDLPGWYIMPFVE